VLSGNLKCLRKNVGREALELAFPVSLSPSRLSVYVRLADLGIELRFHAPERSAAIAMEGRAKEQEEEADFA
jgi:hypothetical protein